MEHLAAVGGEVDHSAHALDAAEALVANHLDDGLAAVPFLGGSGGAGGLGIAQGENKPADLVAARRARVEPRSAS